MLLLLSNSTNHGSAMFAHAREALARSFDGREVLFVPYAAADHDAYSAKAVDAFAGIGVRARQVPARDPAAAIRGADAVFVGGGNSFRLLRDLQRTGLIAAIREAVAHGARYGGASAGTNMACPTLCTTNDMPIVEPAGFGALGLLPFQINPHYLERLSDGTSTLTCGDTYTRRL
ncbi:dipeptidase PepE [Pseudonocardia sp. T1-2H]|uniref:dipeptidase PepE n=1 Tax=Pseudonocardia sp. T1-2H TaxID=3128899 RepID=UPI003100BFF1